MIEHKRMGLDLFTFEFSEDLEDNVEQFSACTLTHDLAPYRKGDKVQRIQINFMQGVMTFFELIIDEKDAKALMISITDEFYFEMKFWRVV